MLVPNSDHRLFHSSKNTKSPRRVLILGSTGSIGVSALDIFKANPDKFEVFGLIAGSNVELLNRQISEFKPRFAGLSDKSKVNEIDIPKGNLVSGIDDIVALTRESEIDLVLASIVGMAGLAPVLSALEADKIVALANKESLVAGGPFVSKIINSGKGTIIPVDSEHSAIFQAIQGEKIETIKRLFLTASGGPFLSKKRAELSTVTPEEAIKHPRWRMGKKISVDSATMMNKALELIEAYWLFGISPKQIEVLIHPQSIVHSLVEYCDGSQIAQLSNPDMKGPISYALSYPDLRVAGAVKHLDLTSIRELTFLPLDNARFPALNLAREALSGSEFAPAVLNSANEVAVDLFLNSKLSFDRIEESVKLSLDRFGDTKCADLAQLIDLDKSVRATVLELSGR